MGWRGGIRGGARTIICIRQHERQARNFEEYLVCALNHLHQIEAGAQCRETWRYDRSWSRQQRSCCACFMILPDRSALSLRTLVLRSAFGIGFLVCSRRSTANIDMVEGVADGESIMQPVPKAHRIGIHHVRACRPRPGPSRRTGSQPEKRPPVTVLPARSRPPPPQHRHSSACEEAYWKAVLAPACPGPYDSVRCGDPKIGSHFFGLFLIVVSHERGWSVAKLFHPRSLRLPFG